MRSDRLWRETTWTLSLFPFLPMKYSHVETWPQGIQGKHATPYHKFHRISLFFPQLASRPLRIKLSNKAIFLCKIPKNLRPGKRNLSHWIWSSFTKWISAMSPNHLRVETATQDDMVQGPPRFQPSTWPWIQQCPGKKGSFMPCFPATSAVEKNAEVKEYQGRIAKQYLYIYTVYHHL